MQYNLLKARQKYNQIMTATTLTFAAIGTKWQIDFSPLPAKKLQIVEKEIHQLIDSFDKDYSRFREDSLVTKMSHATGTYLLPDTAKPMFELYRQLYELSDFTFTPTIGSLLEEAGYDATYSLIPGHLHHPVSWEESMSLDYPHITIKKPVLLDFGAAGKGYLIDLVASLLRNQQIDSFCVDAGGDIYYSNLMHKKLQVGLEHPLDATQVIGIATIVNQSICASAGNRRRWKGYHHIMNPHTLSSATGVLATWVIADSALLADALATCLFFSPPSQFSQFNFSYALVKDDLSLEKSSTFPAEIFTTHTKTMYA